MQSRLSSRAAFTLIEVLVAILLLAIGLVALEGLVATTVRQMAETHHEAVAAQLVRHRIEQMRPCAAGSGVDSLTGVRVTWLAAVTDGVLTAQVTSAFHTSRGTHEESYQASWRCL